MSDVLIIESQTRLRERMTQFLAEHRVTQFADAGDAIGAIQAADSPVDLIVLAWDVAGDMSGAEFLLRLQQRDKSLPVIVVSPALTLDIRNRAFSLGATDLLLKPVNGNRLRQAVHTAMREPGTMDPLVGDLRRELIGNSREFVNAIVRLAQAIRSDDLNVLLIGESGVGKEIFAQLLHRHGRSDDGAMVDVNVTALGRDILESELFGHEAGAFTGARNERVGKLEHAARGTLFLDEIGLLDPSLQPKLLRAIDQREFCRVGGNQVVPFTARLVCATSRNLAKAVHEGTFRSDLYYRISTFEIRVPPLRERMDDLPELAEHFLKGTGLRLERETLALLSSYSFPGNVRELRDILMDARAVRHGKVILPKDLPGEIMQEREAGLPEVGFNWPEAMFAKPRDEALAEIERQFDAIYLARRIEEAAGNKELAARQMGITPKTLRQKLRDCGLSHLIRSEVSK